MLLKLLFLFSVAISTASLFIPALREQSQIISRIIDETGRAVPYASLLLKNQSDSALFKTAFTANDGAFKFTVAKSGNYFLEVRMVGFGDFVKRETSDLTTL